MIRLQRLTPESWGLDWARVRACHARLGSAAPAGWRELASVLARRWSDLTRPPGTLVISGGQGAGKSTLTACLVDAFRHEKVNAIGLSLDDYYLGRAARARFAAAVHPLFMTRGVPGTHDLAALEHDLDGLRRLGSMRLRRFDKGRDEPLAESDWRPVEPPFDLVIIEGWCLGLQPETEALLRNPVNSLERSEDPQGTWRRYVNGQLEGRFGRLVTADDFVVYLQVPDMAAVRRWRAHQEKRLPRSQRMSRVELDRFIAHFERLTLALDRQLSGCCTLTVGLGPRHGIRRLEPGPRSF